MDRIAPVAEVHRHRVHRLRLHDLAAVHPRQDQGRHLFHTQIGGVDGFTHLGVNGSAQSHDLPDPFQLVGRPQEWPMLHPARSLQDPLRRGGETDDVAIHLEAAEVFGIDDRSPARGNDAPLHLGEARDHGPLYGAEDRLPPIAKDRRDAQPRLLLDQFVAIVERELKAVRQVVTDRGLPRPHHPGQHDVSPLWRLSHLPLLRNCGPPPRTRQNSASSRRGCPRRTSPATPPPPRRRPPLLRSPRRPAPRTRRIAPRSPRRAPSSPGPPSAGARIASRGASWPPGGGWAPRWSCLPPARRRSWSFGKISSRAVPAASRRKRSRRAPRTQSGAPLRSRDRPPPP